MWLGELITARGIGNGMSIIIFISIVSRIPSGAAQAVHAEPAADRRCFMVIALAVVVGVIWITTGERRIPVQYAKRVVGRRMMGGQSTFIPLKVNMAGVIPVIFASSVMMIIPTFAQFLGTSGVGGWFTRTFGPSTFLYIIGEAILIIIFTYFYTAVHVQPHRPGRQPQEVRRVHPRRASRPADGGVPRPHPHPADVPGRPVPGGPRGAAVAAVAAADQRPVLLRRHLAAHRGRRRARHDAADGGAAPHAALRRLPQVGDGEMTQQRNVILLGGPGAGKGTQAERIVAGLRAAAHLDR